MAKPAVWPICENISNSRLVCHAGPWTRGFSVPRLHARLTHETEADTRWAMLTVDEFWLAIERARSGASDAYETAAALRAQLAERPAGEIMAFLEQQARMLARSYSWALWGAAYLINGGCSDDGFHYFRGWLIAQGREVFERALEHPDSLADVIDEGDAECEDMPSAAALAYKDVTGAYPDGPRLDLPDLGPSWDFDDAAEMAKRYPRLSAREVGGERVELAQRALEEAIESGFFRGGGSGEDR